MQLDLNFGILLSKDSNDFGKTDAVGRGTNLILSMPASPFPARLAILIAFSLF